MSLLKELGIIEQEREQKKYTLDKMPRLQVFTKISTLFALFDDKICPELNGSEIQRLVIEIFEVLQKYQEELDENHQIRFANFIVHFDPANIKHAIENLNTQENIYVGFGPKENFIIAQKHRVTN